MADSVEGIVIEIESQSGAAISDLEALGSALESLKTKLSNNRAFKTFSKNYVEMVNTFNNTSMDVSKLESFNLLAQIVHGFTSKSVSPLKSFARNYTEAVNSLNNGAAFDTDKVENLRYFAEVIGQMKGLTISSTIAKQLDNIGFVTQNINPESFQSITELAKALIPLSELKVSISKSFVDNFERLVELSQKMQGYDFAKLNEFTSALANMGSLANVDSSAVKGLNSSISKLSNTTRTATTRGRTFNTVLANIRTKTVAILMVTRRLSQYTMKAMSVYGNYVEALNLYKMALGAAAKAEYEFAEQAQNILGIDLTQWMQAQGVFSALASGFGVASDKAALMSRNLTQLAYDISSFYNISVEDAIQKVQSGFAGQIRPVRNLGYDLSQAKLEAIALANGIDKEVKSMTQAEKAQLRYVALMTQLTQVQGDLARTLDSPTNQMRLLNAQLDQMTRSIGMTLLPILNKVIPYLNAIFRVIKMIAEEIAAMFGYTLPRITSGDWTSSVTMGAEDLEEDLEDATGAAEKLKNTLASFDQINLITSKSGGSGSGGSSSVGGSDLGIDLPSYDFLGDAGANKAQEIADNIMKAIRPFVEYLKDFIKWVVDNIDAITKALEILAGVILLDKVVGALSNVFDLGDKVGKLFKNLEFIVVGLQFSFMGGKELASGNFATGLIESAIGAAFLAKGMSFAFGPGGIIIGLGVSFVMTLAGYLTEKDAQRVEANIKIISDAFYKLRDNADGLDYLRDSWQKFTERFYSPEASEKSSVAKQTEQAVLNIADGMGELYRQYSNGTITASMFAANLEVMYGQMEDAVKKHLKATGDAITEYLNGPYGLWLQKNHYVISEIEQTVEDVTTQIQKEIEKNELKLQEYNHALETGALSFDEYNKKVEELLGPLSDYYASLIANSGATKEFTETFNNMDLNFEDYDTLMSSLDEVGEAYKNASKSIDQEVADIQAHLRTYINAPGVTDAQKALFESLIEEADKYGKEQKRILDDSYVNVLESIENQAAINWSETLAMHGFESTVLAMSYDMETLDDKLEELYGMSSRERSNDYWSSLMKDINDFDSDFAASAKQRGFTLDEWGSVLENLRGNYKEAVQVFDYVAMGEQFNKYDEIIKKSSAEYALYVLKQKKSHRELTEDEERFLTALEYNYGDTTDQIRRKVQVHFDRMGNIVAVTSDSMIDDMSYATGAIGTMIGNDAWAVSPMYSTMSDVEKAIASSNGAFTNSFWGLMNSASRVLCDPTGMLQRSLLSSLNMPVTELIGIGAEIGIAIAEGITDSSSSFTAAAHYCASEAATEWNKFGEEAYNYFINIFDNASTVFGIFGNTATSSTFNPKKAKIKGYASGGFPDTADFFFANENGVPEYVGTMGGRTAVANNMEITKGVADGVYKAIKDTGLIGDVRKIASKDGKVVFAPSEEAGKVMSQSVGMYNGTGGRY